MICLVTACAELIRNYNCHDAHATTCQTPDMLHPVLSHIYIHFHENNYI